MKSTFVSEREFIRGVASRADRLFLLSKGKKLIEADYAHTSAVSLVAGQWMDVLTTEWDSTAIAVARLPAPKLVIVGEDGQVAAYLGDGKYDKESITPKPVMVRHARTIEGHVVVCGMKRQVYRRVDEARWVDMSAPFPGPEERVGFEAIDAYSFGELYAVGWAGEIWEYDGARWIDRQSPTNLILASVCCAPDGQVYAAGQQGVMLRGRHANWEVVDWEDDVGADIWDLCWYMDKLYVATMTNLYTLQGNALVPVIFGDAPITTCFNLSVADGVLWSVGRDDIASFDGVNWRVYV